MVCISQSTLNSKKHMGKRNLMSQNLYTALEGLSNYLSVKQMCWNSMYYISSSKDKQWLYRQGDKVQ